MQTTSLNPQVGGPAQVVYLHQPTPVNFTTTSVQNAGSRVGRTERFNGAAGRATGWIQICCGIACIVVAISQLVLQTQMGYSGYGIWAALLFYIPTGILGIFTMEKNTCVIISYLTMSIIAAVSAAVQCCVGLSWGITSDTRCDSDRYAYYGLYEDHDCERGAREGRIASDSLLAVLGLVEMIAAIVGSAYCCGPICCETSSSTMQQTTVVTQGTPMIVSSGVPTQHALVQPPPYNVQQAYPPAGQFGQPYSTGQVA